MRFASPLYEALFNHAGDGICLADEHGRILDVNRRLCTSLGYSRDQLLAMHVSDFEVGHSPEELIEFWQQLTPDTPQTAGGLHLRADGTTLPVEVRAVAFSHDGRRFVFAITRDIAERKRAEEALKLSEERYRRIVEDQTELICRSLPDGTLTFVNDIYCRHMGLPREKLVGVSYFRFLPEEAVQQMRASLDSITPENTAITTRHAAVTSSGETRHYEWIDRGLFDEGGKLIEVQSIGRDITAEVQAEEALQLSEERYRRIIEDHTELIGRALPDGTVLFVNESCCRYFNIQRDDLIGRNVYDFIPEEDRARLMQTVESLTPADPVATSDHRVVMPGGGPIRLHQWTKRGIFDDRGNLLEVQGAGRDITEYRQAMLDLRKAHEDICRANDRLEQRVRERTAELSQANEELRRSEEKYRQLVELSPDAIMIRDFNGVILQVNSAFERAFGWSRNEIVGRTVEDVGPMVAADHRRFENELLPRLMRDGILTDIEFTARRSDGTTLPALLSCTLMRGADGSPTGIIMVGRDITSQKAAENKLIDYQHQLRSLASELSLAEERSRREIATILHDRIGQMLAAIKLKLDALRASPRLPEQTDTVAEAIALIEQTIQDARSLTQELSPPLLYEFGLEAALQWLADEFRKQHSIDVVFSDDGTDKPLDNDVRAVLFQAARELLVNIDKHSQATAASISIARRRKNIELSVEDNGVGFRLDQVGPSRFRAGGFGLFNIRERLQHLGGKLEVDSEPGRGTRLKLTAPLTIEAMKS